MRDAWAKLGAGLVSAAVVAGCAGGQKAVADAGSGATAPSGWAEMNRQQRMDFMGLEVFPKMKSVFTQYDGEGYADFACQTCHGDDMEVNDFSMPSDIFAISADDPIASAQDYDEEVTAFMVDVVVPEMARLLGKVPGESESETTFSCFGCHPTE